MKLFNILTEALIREWENKSPKEKASISTSFDRNPESFEQQLLEEINEKIEAARFAEESQQIELIKESRKLEVQLMASLEKQSLNLTARRIAEELEERRSNAIQ